MAYYIGTLSGTSLDGLDIALVHFDKKLPKVIQNLTIKYPKMLKETLRTIIQEEAVSFKKLAKLDKDIATLTANGIKQLLEISQVDSKEVQAIGFHGQTLFHIPGHYSLQIGDSNQIAYQTGIPVVSDFRRMDIAAGGEGAPLSPLIHQALFYDPSVDTTVINLGGIANITVLPKENPNHFIGYDTGPANTLLDNWCERYHNQPFDKGGQWARQGQVLPDLLEKMRADNYFKKDFPKSTGPEHFNLAWIEQHIVNTHNAQDVQCTLTELTAITIAQEVKKHFKEGRVLLCGGGCHNTYLVERIARYLHGHDVMTTNSVGFDCDSLEAVFFAWLARKRYKKESVQLKRITGSEAPICLGAIYFN